MVVFHSCVRLQEGITSWIPIESHCVNPIKSPSKDQQNHHEITIEITKVADGLNYRFKVADELMIHSYFWGHFHGTTFFLAPFWEKMIYHGLITENNQLSMV